MELSRPKRARTFLANPLGSSTMWEMSRFGNLLPHWYHFGHVFFMFFPLEKTNIYQQDYLFFPRKSEVLTKPYSGG